MARYVYVGASTQTGQGDSHQPRGITVYQMDSSTGALTHVADEESGKNPSFLVMHPTRRFLYSVNETRQGEASAFAVDRATGRLNRLNTVSVQGNGPAYVTIDEKGAWVVVANYGSGNLTVLPVMSDGKLGEAVDTTLHEGASVDPKRQEGPHAHSIIFDPGYNYALSADLGTDQIYVYTLDETHGRLLPNDFASVPADPGAGPRHLAFHPNRRYLYCANELNNTVTLYGWDSQTGRLSHLDSFSTLPSDFTGHSQVADIHFSPDANYLYVSNRGHNSIAVYGVTEADGQLRTLGFVSTGGDWPRNFSVDPEGNFMIVANQESSTLNVFRLDKNTGLPAPVGQPVQVEKPMFVTIVDL